MATAVLAPCVLIMTMLTGTTWAVNNTTMTPPPTQADVGSNVTLKRLMLKSRDAIESIHSLDGAVKDIEEFMPNVVNATKRIHMDNLAYHRPGDYSKWFCRAVSQSVLKLRRDLKTRDGRTGCKAVVLAQIQRAIHMLHDSLYSNYMLHEAAIRRVLDQL